jgi:hypothetical protein
MTFEQFTKAVGNIEELGHFDKVIETFEETMGECDTIDGLVAILDFMIQTYTVLLEGIESGDCWDVQEATNCVVTLMLLCGECNRIIHTKHNKLDESVFGQTVEEEVFDIIKSDTRIVLSHLIK